jgi:hypothetical protein
VAKDAHPDNGWFVFGVVRDPRTRLFSAWEDKLLLHEPGFRWARDKPWFPEFPRDAETIVADFARFVDAALELPTLRLFEDDHFRSQVGTLLPETIPYSRIYPIEEMAQLRTDLSRHVEALGWTEPLNFRRSNDNPLRATAAVFAAGVAAKVEQLYAEDFAAFGDFWDLARIDAMPDWTPAQLHEAQVRASIGRRLGDVRHIALDYRRKAEEAAAHVETLQRDRMKLDRRLTAVEGRLTKVESRLTKLGSRLSGFGTRLTTIERKAKRAVREQQRAAARRPRARARRFAGRVARLLRLRAPSGSRVRTGP